MKKIFPIILLLLVALSGYAKGIDGTWIGKMQGPDGDMELTFIFKMVDGKLTGTVRSPNGDMEITNTKVNGKEFSFDVALGDMTIKHNCTLKEDDTITLKVVGAPMGDMEMKLNRQM